MFVVFKLCIFIAFGRALSDYDTEAVKKKVCIDQKFEVLLFASHLLYHG